MRKVHFKRIISLLGVFVISFSILAVPVSAADTSSNGMTFWDWLTYLVEKSNESAGQFDKNTCGGGGGRTAYDTYVSGVQTDLGTATVIDGGIRMYYVPSFCSASYATLNGFNLGTTSNASALAQNGTGSSSINFYFNSSTGITAPFAGTYTNGFQYTMTGTYFSKSYYVSSSKGVLKGSKMYLSGNSSDTANLYTYGATVGTFFSFSLMAYVDLVPVTGTLSDYTSSSIDASTRTGSLSGNYIYTGNDGTQMTAENIYLFDESTNTVNNPQTGTTATASSWTYDYATRTYTIKATDGSTYVITMGDDQATQAVTNSSGTTITYNYYYASSSSSDGSDDDDSGTSWWEKILNKLSDGILAIFDLVGTVIGSIIGGLADLVTSVVTSLKDLVNSFSQLPSAIGSIFTWLPPQMQSVLIAAFTVLIFAGLIKVFL